jgi:FkbM family methyltransferase
MTGWQPPSYALDELDLRLEPFLKRRGGFFIEAGANDGIQQSNTLFFERHRGWTGLLIEPIPELAQQCRKNRPDCIVEQAALVPDGYSEETVELRYCDLMSVVKGGLESEEAELDHIRKGTQFLSEKDTPRTVSAPARSLGSILDKHDINDVDLLSLDVEGYEAEALKGLDFPRQCPKYLLIEVWNMSEILKVIDTYYAHVATLQVHERRKDMLFRVDK